MTERLVNLALRERNHYPARPLDEITCTMQDEQRSERGAAAMRKLYDADAVNVCQRGVEDNNLRDQVIQEIYMNR